MNKTINKSIDITLTTMLALIAAVVVTLLAVMRTAPWQMVILYWVVLTVKNVKDLTWIILGKLSERARGEDGEKDETD